ncbi:MAG TPA: glycosyltransferase family 2 protein [Bdellovibrionales bacterium]|nr:glycosyltransferase family 2 protein [Bdellovibrionales bacterium]
MTPLSLIVITLNAEKHIARCLQSVPFASDVVVLDSGSSDRTVEIARALGARVFVEEWRGFGPQKRRATELAGADWVLSLDADEALSLEAQEELRARLAGDMSGPDAFAFPRLSFHMGRWIRHGGWYPDWQIRLYDRRRAGWSRDVLHEKVQAERVERLRRPLHHWVFTDLTDQVRTNNRYSGLGADQLANQGRRFSLFHLIVKPKVKFFEVYVWKRGFLDGMPGFIIAVGAAYSVFLKWAKLWEREQKR